MGDSIPFGSLTVVDSTRRRPKLWVDSAWATARRAFDAPPLTAAPVGQRMTAAPADALGPFGSVRKRRRGNNVVGEEKGRKREGEQVSRTG